VTIGQANAPVSVTLTNANTSPDQSADNTVCDPGIAPAPAACTGSAGILFSPACTDVVAGACTAAERRVFHVTEFPYDGNLFVLNRSAALASPRVDPPLEDQCPGDITIREVGTTGTWLIKQDFDPPIVLTAADPSCKLHFYVGIRGLPQDVDGATPGAQARQVVAHRQYAGSASDDSSATSTATVNRSATVNLAPDASSSVQLGNVIYDTVTTTGLVGPIDGTVTFDLYPPSDPTCAGTPVFTDTQDEGAVGSTGFAKSNNFFPQASGTYRWTVTYSGDGRNVGMGPVGCADPRQLVEVGPRPATEQPPAPAPPQGEARTGKRARALKACSKGKNKAKVKRCKRKARKLP
jgi:hypothetical protein